MIKGGYETLTQGITFLFLQDKTHKYFWFCKAMSLQSILSFTFLYLRNFSKQKLVNQLLLLRDQYPVLVNKNNELEQEINRLKDELTKQKVQQINKAANQPTSKQPEWELKGVGNDGQGKKKGRGKRGRKGAGNKAKDRPVTHHETAKVENCDICGRDLSEQPPLKTENVRIIEDIPSLSVSTPGQHALLIIQYFREVLMIPAGN